MCGIAGIIDFEDPSQVLQKLQVLSEDIKKRGPDKFNLFVSDEDPIGLSHSRLSIIDLSVNGDQPMFTQDRSKCLVFNGEIYNHKSIKKTYLDNVALKGNSDTEILLNFINNNGIDLALEKIKGMFSFFYIDFKKKEFILARDRAGEKPVSYFSDNERFYFSSEVNCISKILKKDERQFNHESINFFLTQGNFPAPYSIYKNIKKVLPGSYLIGNFHNNEIKVSERMYWDIEEASELTFHDNHEDLLERELYKVIDQQLISDRNLGCFLSGGIDSSLISSIASKLKDNLNTYTISFDNFSYDESEKAKKVANILGTQHHTINFTSKNLLDSVPKISEVYDEPFADKSMLPTMLICKSVKQKGSIVNLTGDGGDELFAGYNRYKYLTLFKYLRNIFKVLSILGVSLPPFSSSNKSFTDMVRWINLSIKSSNKTDHLNLYFSILNKTQNNFLPQSRFYSKFIKDKDLDISLIEKFMIFDFKNYLSNDILVKTDRASMFNGMELRAPFLDQRIIELSKQIPIDKKINKSKTKIILKRILSKYLPEEIIYQKKKGFDVPLAKWLKGELRDWANDIHNSSIGFEIPHEKKYQAFFHDHMNKNRDFSEHLWPYLMLKNWILNRK